MTHKELLTEIHKKTKLDKQQVSALVSALEHILVEEAISGQTVEIEGLGQFISHKHPEFIKTDEETGQSVLYPPRISYRFNSSIKV
ncbi:MAG: HU family DNA-binding protein [Bacteroidales bacterium]|nr:HU family DNA-binding protein [Bacteroidales bacterium]